MFASVIVLTCRPYACVRMVEHHHKITDADGNVLADFEHDVGIRLNVTVIDEHGSHEGPTVLVVVPKAYVADSGVPIWSDVRQPILDAINACVAQGPRPDA